MNDRAADKSTFESEFAAKCRRWPVRAHPSKSDGLALLVFKSVTSPFSRVWKKVFFDSLVPNLEGLSRWTCRKWFGNDFDVSVQFRLAIDIYKLVMSTFLLLNYLATYYFTAWSCTAETAHRLWLLAIPATLGLGRFLEVMCLLVYLHADEKYQPSRAIRTVVNTAWHYAEATLFFAIVTCCILAVDRDAVCNGDGQPPIGSVVEPVYYSFVTITTLGYGDYSPRTWPAQVAVMAEVASGFYILLVVLQVAVATLMAPRQKASNLLSSTQPWMQLRWDDSSRLWKSREGDFEVGAVLVIRHQTSQEFVMVMKAPVPDYPFGNLRAFPGGMVRRGGAKLTTDLVQASLRDRVLQETKLQFEEAELRIHDMPVPPVTRYPADSQQKTVVVLPFVAKIHDTALDHEHTTKSTTGVEWIHGSFPWWDIAPANRIILAYTVWHELSGEQQRDAVKPLAEAFEFCRRAAESVGLPAVPPLPPPPAHEREERRGDDL